MELFTTLAGIAWEPTIRGIITVVIAVVILCGSVYLIIATNTGARLGLLISLAGFFGWMVVLTLFWWIVPPGIGPRGENPSWQPVEIYFEGDIPPENADAQTLPPSDALPTPDEVIAEHPELAGEFVSPPILSDIAGVAPEVLPGRDDLGGWKIMSTADSGEAQASADVALLDNGFFTATSEYRKLNAFATGGKPQRSEECADDDVLCRVWYRIRIALMPTHPPHYAVVQVQPVVYQEPVPGAAPPTPIVDESKPVMWVILERDLGSVRFLPFTYFVVSLALFIVFALVLHYRDKTLQKNLDAAKDVVKAGA